MGPQRCPKVAVLSMAIIVPRSCGEIRSFQGMPINSDSLRPVSF